MTARRTTISFSWLGGRAPRWNSKLSRSHRLYGMDQALQVSMVWKCRHCSIPARVLAWELLFRDCPRKDFHARGISELQRPGRRCDRQSGSGEIGLLPGTRGGRARVLGVRSSPTPRLARFIVERSRNATNAYR